MRTVITIDFGKLMNWQMYALILIFTALIGFYNQCNYYEPLNHLPTNRTELTPIGKIDIGFEEDSNVFVYNIEHHSVLKVTKENLESSINVLVRTDFFEQRIPLTDSYERDNTMTYLKGKITIHSIGPIQYQLFYMYEPISEVKNFTIEKASLTFPTNSIIDCNNERCEFSHVCLMNSSIQVFSQQKFKQLRMLPSLDYSNCKLTSIIDHNYKDFQDWNKAPIVENGYIFYGRSKPANTQGRLKNIVKPIIKYFDNTTRGNNRVYIIDSSDVVATDEEIEFDFETLDHGFKCCFDKIIVPLDQNRIRLEELFSDLEEDLEEEELESDSFSEHTASQEEIGNNEEKNLELETTDSSVDEVEASHKIRRIHIDY